MRLKKKALLAGVMLCCMPMMTACSVKETLGILWNSDETTDDQESVSSNADLEAANIDENVEKPTITNELGDAVTYGLNGEAEALTVEATVSDGGTLSYQWYRNNVDSNGGGTEIEGAVESSFVPSTSEAGITYYYVVVTNTIGDGIQLTASPTKCVTVTEEPAAEVQSADTENQDAQGTWKQSDNGWWFEYADGTYPSNQWEKINGEWYAFDENGYMRKGWYQDGDKWYYLNEDGSMAHDTDVEGYHLGSDGVMQ